MKKGMFILIATLIIAGNIKGQPEEI